MTKDHDFKQLNTQQVSPSVLERNVFWPIAINVVLLCFISFTVSMVAIHKVNEIKAPDNNPPTVPVCATVHGKHGIVAANHPLAAQAGLNVLKNGGNAFDAAAAIQFALNVVEPHMSGIGGGAFIMIYKSATGEILALESREEAPNAVTPTYFCINQSDPTCAAGPWPIYPERQTGGMPVGVPGTLSAFDRLLREHGTITLSEALQEAISLAENGFPMSPSMNLNVEGQKARLKVFPATAKLLFKADGSSYNVGDILRNPDLADTFELIAENGISEFYNGSLASEIIEAVQTSIYPPTNRSGAMELSDLSNYQAVYRYPTNVSYRGEYQVFGMSGPSSGGPTLGLILNLLEGIDFENIVPFSVEHVHRLAEAQNIAFADRNQYMGDPDFVNVPLAGLLNKTYALSRRALMQLFTAVPTPIIAGNPPGASNQILFARETEPEFGTTHFIAADQWGNVASVTSTIEMGFGSGVVVPGRGFFLNNELTDFDAVGFDAQGVPVANGPEGGRKQRRTAVGVDQYTYGGKRPRSSMTPTIVLQNGKPIAAVGAPGGSFIIGYVLNPLHKILDYDMCLAAAITSPDIVSRNGAMSLNPNDPTWGDYAKVQSSLLARGFQQPATFVGGNNHAVKINSDGYEGSPNLRLVTSTVLAY